MIMMMIMIDDNDDIIYWSSIIEQIRKEGITLGWTVYFGEIHWGFASVEPTIHYNLCPISLLACSRQFNMILRKRLLINHRVCNSWLFLVFAKASMCIQKFAFPLRRLMCLLSPQNHHFLPKPKRKPWNSYFCLILSSSSSLILCFFSGHRCVSLPIFSWEALPLIHCAWGELKMLKT